MAKKKAAKKQQAPASEVDFADKLRSETIAVRFSRSVFGARRTLTPDQRRTAAEAFGAGDGWVAGGKKLLDTKREEYKRATGRVLAALTAWRDATVPYPEPGIRLLRRDKLEDFESRMRQIHADLEEAVVALDAVYEDAKEQAKASLGDLFDEEDYPSSLTGSFGFSWSFPSVDPPEYLRKLNPKLWEEQQEMVRARFAAAVVEAEQMLATELSDMLGKWIASLTPDAETGKRKTIKSTSVESFKNLITRCRELSVGANGTLAAVLDGAEQVANGLDPEDLKKNNIAADALRERIEQMKSSLATIVEDAPERAIDLGDE